MNKNGVIGIINSEKGKIHFFIDYQMISIPHFRSVIAAVMSLAWLPRSEPFHAETTCGHVLCLLIISFIK